MQRLGGDLVEAASRRCTSRLMRLVLDPERVVEALAASGPACAAASGRPRSRRGRCRGPSGPWCRGRRSCRPCRRCRGRRACGAGSSPGAGLQIVDLHDSLLDLFDRDQVRDPGDHARGSRDGRAGCWSCRCRRGRGRAACRGASAWCRWPTRIWVTLSCGHHQRPRRGDVRAALGLAVGARAGPWARTPRASRPRRRATSSGRLSALRPAMVARATLMWLDEPSDLHEHVVDAGLLEDGAGGATGDDAGTGSGRLQQHPAGAHLADDRVGDGACRRAATAKRFFGPPRCPSGWRGAPPWPCRSRGRRGRRRRRSPRAR